MIDPFALDETSVGEPLSLVKGQSTQWRRNINIDDTLFTVSYVLRHYVPSAVVIDYEIVMVSVASGVFAADIEPSDVTDWIAGRYYWDMVVTRISDSRTKVVETGEFRVFDTATDRRSHAEVMVSKIEGVLENRADNDVESYTIKSRSITKMSASELRQWRDYYLREIANQPANGGIFKQDGPKKNTLRVRFRD